MSASPPEPVRHVPAPPAPSSPPITWLARLKRLKGPIVAIAGIGAVLSGLVGWYTTYNTVRNAASASKPSIAATAPAEPLSVAVMPFANQTGDTQKAYIADGLTSSLTSDLSRIQDAYVVPAAAAFAYRDKGLTVQQLGKALGVGYVLSGSVISGGEKLRITAQLTDARTGAQVWSRSFDGELGDLIALQDQVTTETATSTGRAMLVSAVQQGEKQKSSPSAMDLRLRARALGLQPQSEEVFEKRQALLRQALALEPTNAATQLELASALWLLARNWDRGDPATNPTLQKHLAEARALAAQASAALPDHPGACRLMGQFSQMDGQLEAARSVMERCLAANPKSTALLGDLANTYMHDGAAGANKAVALLQKAITIDGVHPKEMAHMNLGEALFAAGDSAAAIPHLQQALRLNPKVTESYWYLAMAYADLGDTAHLQEVKAKFTSPQEPAHELQGGTFKEFERYNSVDTPAYRTLRDTRMLPAWRKAGLPE